MEWLEKLRQLKDTTSETYRTLSEKTGIAQTTIEKLFCGRTKDPKLTMMRDIVHCLGYTLDDLVETTQQSQYKCSEEAYQYVKMYNNLNKTGKQKAIDYLNDLNDNPKYTSEDAKQHPPNSTETTTSKQLQQDITQEIADAVKKSTNRV